MKPMALALVAGLAALSLSSCTREKAAPKSAGSEAAEQASPEAPMIPVDVMPKVLEAKVNYPEEAQARGEQGIVMVKALVGKDGLVKQTAVDPGQPVSDALGKAAVEAVKGWRFEPARSKGEPVEVWIVVPVNFRLQ